MVLHAVKPADYICPRADRSICLKTPFLPTFPAAITKLLCELMGNGSAAIIYFTNTEKFGRSTAASQYFLQMAREDGMSKSRGGMDRKEIS